MGVTVGNPAGVEGPPHAPDDSRAAPDGGGQRPRLANSHYGMIRAGGAALLYSTRSGVTCHHPSRRARVAPPPHGVKLQQPNRGSQQAPRGKGEM